MNHRARGYAVALLSSMLAAVVVGCDRNTSETINTSDATTPPPTSSTPAQSPAGANAPMTDAGAPAAAPAAQPAGETKLKYTLPAGWTEAPGGSAMRFATLKGPDGLEIAVSVFGGAVGGDLANVNRWRGQMQQPEITQDQLAKNLTKVQTAGPAAQMVDIKNPDGSQRMLAAIVPDQGRMWFLKLVGPTAAVDKHADEYTQILKSVSIAPQ